MYEPRVRVYCEEIIHSISCSYPDIKISYICKSPSSKPPPTKPLSNNPNHLATAKHINTSFQTMRLRPQGHVHKASPHLAIPSWHLPRSHVIRSTFLGRRRLLAKRHKLRRALGASWQPQFTAAQLGLCPAVAALRKEGRGCRCCCDSIVSTVS